MGNEYLVDKYEGGYGLKHYITLIIIMNFDL